MTLLKTAKSFAVPLFFTMALSVFVTQTVDGVVIGCKNAHLYVGRSWCDPWGGLCGECVSFIKICTGNRETTHQWRPSDWVRETPAHRGRRPPYGMAIATFPNGRYFGHTAIYIDQNENGLWVYDQWKGVNLERRFMRWDDGSLTGSGNNYYVVDVIPTPRFILRYL